MLVLARTLALLVRDARGQLSVHRSDCCGFFLSSVNKYESARQAVGRVPLREGGERANSRPCLCVEPNIDPV